MSLFFISCFLMSMISHAEAEYPNHIATYASKKPVIDGKIDDIWEKTEKMVGEQINWFYGTQIPEGTYEGDLVKSYAQILWDEEGLYLLGVVFDTTITKNDVDARNSVDFWISECNTKEMGYQISGDWNYCLASDGTEQQYVGLGDICSVVEKAIKIYRDKYVVEAFVPYQSTLKPKDGIRIGFNVSFNDDTDGDGVSNVCTYWKVSDDSQVYWGNTGALPEIILKEDVQSKKNTTLSSVIIVIFIVVAVAIITGVSVIYKTRHRSRR